MRDTLDFLLHDWLRVEALLDAAAFRRSLARDLRLGARHLRAHRAREVRAVQPRGRYRGAALRRREGDPAGELARTRRRRPTSSPACWPRRKTTNIGGMQLPCVVEMAANAFFSKAGIGIGGGGLLTSGNANLLMAHGTPLQREVFAKNEFAGRWFGTMCLSEPQAGSSLSRRRHARRARRRRLRGRPARPALPADAATRCGSATASTSSPRTSCTWCWPRSRGRTASWCPAPGASRCSSCRRSW